MANVIKHKRGSGSDPAANNLVIGELAIRTDNGKLFTKMDSGAIAEIAGGGSDIAINTLSSSSGTGGNASGSFDGSAYRFTLSSPPSVSAAQLLVSINGVIQKPVVGTGQPSEGFSVDGNDIILGDAPETGADFFILTFRSLGVSEPADNSVTSAKIANGAIVNADINASAAIAGSKIAAQFDGQDITGRNINLTHNSPTIGFIDSNFNPDFMIQNQQGKLIFQDTTNTANRLVINSDGHVDVSGNLDVGAGIDVTGAITATGNVEIGSSVTNQFSHKLCIEDTSGSIFYAQHSTSGIQLKLNLDNTNNVALFGTVSSDDLQFVTANNNALRIDSSGRVGIGTITPASELDLGSSSSGKRLTFSNYSNLFSEHSSGALWLSSNFYGNAGASGFKTGITGNFGGAAISVNGTGGSSSSGIIEFFANDNSSRTAGDAFTPQERMRITSDGKVLIGSMNSSTFSGISQQLNIGSTTNNEEVALTMNVMEGTHNRRVKFFLDDDDGVFGLDSTASTGVAPFVVRMATGEVFRIASSGKLTVLRSSTTGYSTADTDNDSSVLVENEGSAGHATMEFRVQSGGNANTGQATVSAFPETNSSKATALSFGTRDSAGALAERMRIASFGGFFVYAVHSQTTSAGANVNVQSNGNIVRSTSSVRYKKDITDASWGLTEVLKLKPKTFKNNATGEYADEKIYGGFTAEDVHDLGLTEFVEYDKDNKPDALFYGNMVALMAKAIQELNAKVEALEAK